LQWIAQIFCQKNAEKLEKNIFFDKKVQIYPNFLRVRTQLEGRKKNTNSEYRIL